jgi:hypothetical protein
MRFAADENFDGNILKGLRRRLVDLDIVRVQDTALYQAPDPELLKWTATEERILLTHDVQTIPGYAYERIAQGLSMPGIIAVHRNTPIGTALEELEILIAAGHPEDFENQVIFVPVR